MDKLDVDGETEDKHHVSEPVNLDGEIFVGYYVYQGHIGVDKRSHEADGGKKNICRLPPPSKDGEEGQSGENKEAENRRND
jgi:hypothetical protein